MIEILAHWIIQVIDATGYAGVFLLMTAESALIPIPSEVTMPFSGFLTTTGRFDFWIIVIAGTLGNLAGSLAAYYLGYWGEETVVHTIIKKYGKYFLISVKEVHHAEYWFRKHGEIIVFVSRLLPVIRTFISLPAGIAKMDIKKFIIYTLFGSFLWSVLLTYVGLIMGKNWEMLGSIFHKFDLVISIIFIVVAIWYIRHKVKSLREHHE